MIATDTSATRYHGSFAGKQRAFQLRWEQIGELERLCHAGIGEIAMRLATHTFKGVDVWETIRLGLHGAGDLSKAEADALIEYYRDGQPLDPYVELASYIVDATLKGVKDTEPKKEGESPSSSAGPGTSPPSTGSAASCDGPQSKSTGARRPRSGRRSTASSSPG